MMRRVLRVGLTGNIGSGKSTAALILAELGAHVVDADMIVHGLLMPGTDTHAAIVGAFGNGILQPDGTINRRKLGQIVFEDPEKRAMLESLVHPGVRSVIEDRIRQLEREAPDGIVVVDAALLVETGFYREFDRLIVVTCDPEIQLARIVRRDGLGIDEVRARIEAQMPAEEKAKVADYRIDSSGSLDETRRQIDAVYQELLQEKRLKRRERKEAPGQ
jgi:dephospho-CoA kinase